MIISVKLSMILIFYHFEFILFAIIKCYLIDFKESEFGKQLTGNSF